MDVAPARSVAALTGIKPIQHRWSTSRSGPYGAPDTALLVGATPSPQPVTERMSARKAGKADLTEKDSRVELDVGPRLARCSARPEGVQLALDRPCQREAFAASACLPMRYRSLAQPPMDRGRGRRVPHPMMRRSAASSFPARPRVLRSANCVEHVEHRSWRASVQRPFQRSNRGDDCANQVRTS